MREESATKRKILEAAVGLIWESSYGSVSVDDICVKAGVNKGSFYYAFKSKSDLAVAAFERHWETKRPLLDQVFSPLLAPLDRLARYCQVIVDDQNEKHASFGRVLGCPFCSLGSELSTQDEKIRSKIEEMSLRIMKYLESLVRDLTGEGLISSDDPKDTARELYFYFVGVLMQARIENNLKSLDRLQHGALRLLNVKEFAAGAV